MMFFLWTAFEIQMLVWDACNNNNNNNNKNLEWKTTLQNLQDPQCLLRLYALQARWLQLLPYSNQCVNEVMRTCGSVIRQIVVHGSGLLDVVRCCCWGHFFTFPGRQKDERRLGGHSLAYGIVGTLRYLRKGCVQSTAKSSAQVSRLYVKTKDEKIEMGVDTKNPFRYCCY